MEDALSTESHTVGASLLQRRADLTVELHGGQDVSVTCGRTTVSVGPHALRVLDAFAVPISLTTALDQLSGSVTGARDWMDMTATTMQLIHLDVIVPLADVRPDWASGGRGFSDPWIHIGMLEDERRTSAFLEALRRVVRPGDAVVEIGTGTGVLSVGAARAGASRVYAIEAGPAAAWARSTFAANGVDHVVTLIEGWSTQVQLPEPADVFVGEIVDNEPLTERLLETVLDARARYLKPGARIIPSHVRIYGVPVTVGLDKIRQHRFTQERATAFGERYGVDFSPLVELTRGDPAVCTASPEEARRWPWLSAPVLLVDLDLRTVASPIVNVSETAPATMEGTLNGLFLFFALDLGGGVTLTSDPRGAAYPRSWRLPVWLSGEPVNIAAGDDITMAYAYGRSDLDTLRRVSVTVRKAGT